MKLQQGKVKHFNLSVSKVKVAQKIETKQREKA